MVQFEPGFVSVKIHQDDNKIKNTLVSRQPLLT